jgi:hypothetical protein
VNSGPCNVFVDLYYDKFVFKYLISGTLGKRGPAEKRDADDFCKGNFIHLVYKVF